MVFARNITENFLDMISDANVYCCFLAAISNYVQKMRRADAYIMRALVLLFTFTKL